MNGVVDHDSALVRLNTNIFPCAHHDEECPVFWFTHILFKVKRKGLGVAFV